MDNSQLVDAKVFELLVESAERKLAYDAVGSPRTNYCPDCPDTPMMNCITEYKCPLCSRVESADVNGADIKTLMGANTLSRFRSQGEYARTQKEVIMKQLRENNAIATSKFPMDILEEVAVQYNNIQKLTEAVYDLDGRVVCERKFVHRSDIKDQLLAALIHFVGVERGIYRKKKDIASFMKLQTNGFSTGENILRTLQAEGKIKIVIGDEPIEGFAHRYLDALDIDNENYVGFISEIVKTAENRKIGVNSLPSSKVVGVIWILNTQLKLNITTDQLERAGDNTKKNTFIKFYKEVFKNIGLFSHLFKKYKVPSS
jgi:hypothetical protein